MNLRRPSTTLAASAVALVATLGLVAPASADVEVHRDPRGDVRQLDAGGPRSSADVVRLRGEHAGSRLTFALDLADLAAPADSGDVYAGVRMRTPNGTEFTATANRTDAGKEVTLYRGLGDDVIACPGLEGRFLSDADRIAFVVPRSCVQRPRWVRFGAVVGAGNSSFYADDARRDGQVGNGGLARLGTRLLRRD